MNELPENLRMIVEDFSLLEGQEKLEYLMELAEKLPPLPDWLMAQRDSMEVVHECMTTVFVHVEKEDDGRFSFYLDVPPESPTVRGYATILQTGLISCVLCSRTGSHAYDASTSGPAGMSPKNRSTFSRAVATSMSPASVSTALLGP